MVDLTDIIVAVLTLISALISAFVIPYLKTKVDRDKFEKIKAWVKVAVEAAEMIYVGTGRGDEKKAYVVQYLNSKGYTLDADSINNLIESAVLELKNS
jgi:NAD(P)H-hydrate repair Nnr-like enzyme with NAD(P)H-hydrate dehydratase domain